VVDAVHLEREFLVQLVPRAKKQDADAVEFAHVVGVHLAQHTPHPLSPGRTFVQLAYTILQSREGSLAEGIGTPYLLGSSGGDAYESETPSDENATWLRAMLVYFIATGGVSVLRKAIGFRVLLVWLAQGTVAAQGVSEANAALGKSYTVVMRYDNEGSRKDERNYPDSGGELTDGKLAPTSFWNPAWVGFAQGFERRITVDLEEVHTVSRIWANFLKQSDAGIHLPRFVLFEASAD